MMHVRFRFQKNGPRKKSCMLSLCKMFLHNLDISGIIFFTACVNQNAARLVVPHFWILLRSIKSVIQ